MQKDGIYGQAAETASECREKLSRLGCCVVIPTYNNAGTLADVILGVQKYCADVIVVNDGSTDGTAEILRNFQAGVHILTHPFNWGKGVALQNGLEYAVQSGFRYAVSIDSDGQHYPSDLENFAEAIESGPESLLVGARNLNAEGMPSRNTFANRFSNFWFRIETGIRMDDTQSGFRAYPLENLPLGNRHLTGGYEFELEILVFSAWKGIPVRNIPVRVYYPPEGERVSHFKPLRDFTRISILNILLVFYCLLWKWPYGFFRKLSWKNVRSFVDRYIVHSPDSNARLSSAVALGVFIGVMPVWGYQMIIAFALAHLLKLNKVIALVASNISLPPLIPFIVFGSYWLGCVLTGNPVVFSFGSISLSAMGGMLLQYVIGSIVLGLGLAASFWCLTMTVLTIFRRKRKV